MNTTLTRFRRYGELGLPTEQAEHLVFAEAGDKIPLMIAYYEGRWSSN